MWLPTAMLPTFNVDISSCFNVEVLNQINNHLLDNGLRVERIGDFFEPRAVGPKVDYAMSGGQSSLSDR